MQTAVNPRITNPLLQEGSTLGVPFWQILATTTGGLLTPALSQAAGAPATAQGLAAPAKEDGTDAEPGGPEAGAAGQDQAGLDLAGTGQAAGTTNETDSLSLPAGIAGRGNGASATTVLAQKILTAVTGPSTTRRPGRGGEASPSNAATTSASSLHGAGAPASAVPAPMAALPLNTGVAAPLANEILENGATSQAAGSPETVIAPSAADTGTGATFAVPATLAKADAASTGLPLTFQPAGTAATAAVPLKNDARAAANSASTINLIPSGRDTTTRTAAGTTNSSPDASDSAKQTDAKVVTSAVAGTVTANVGRPMAGGSAGVLLDRGSLPASAILVPAPAVEGQTTSDAAATLVVPTALAAKGSVRSADSPNGTASAPISKEEAAAVSANGAAPATNASNVSAGRVAGGAAATTTNNAAASTNNKVADAAAGSPTAMSSAAVAQNSNGQAGNTAPAAAILVGAGLAGHLPAADAGTQANQSAVPGVASAHAPVTPQAGSAAAATVKTGDGTSSPDKSSQDKSSHADSGNAGAGQAAGNQTASQAANQSAQHTAADAGASAAAKTPDAGAAALGAAAHDAAPAASGHGAEAGRAADVPRAAVGSAAEGNESAATGGINTARLIQTMGETGMQVGMRSTEFGDISIRTMVSQQQMMTQISVDHGDLSRAIAAHVPAMQTKLGEDLGMRASIQVNQTGTSFSGEQGNASGGQQGAYRNTAGTIAMAAEAEGAGYAAPAADEDRLDIQA